MWIGRFRRELDELSKECSRAARAEEAATLELTLSARVFSQHAREVADDKLAFSATLVRAGEVVAAQRLIHDLEKDVRGQQAELTEKLNEVRAAAATRRAKVTRLRLARTLAVAVLAAGLLSFSVAGMTAVSFVAGLNDDSGSRSPSRSGSRSTKSADASPRDAATRSIRLPDGTRVALTQDQFRRIESLTANPNLDRAELERLLLDLVGPRIAAQLASFIESIAKGAEQVTGEVGTLAGDVESKQKGELGLRPDVTKPSAPAPGSDGHEPDSSAEPNDDTDVIDVPLETGPKTSVPDVGGS